LWECPNGGDKCVYTHALPPGYILEREKKELEKAAQVDSDDELTIEEKIEEERAKLNFDALTPVTLDSFMAWKKRKAERKQQELEDKLKEAEKQSGKKGAGTGIMSGRALFKYDPTLFQDDEAAADAQIYEEREEDEQDGEERKDDGGVLAEGDDQSDKDGEEGEDKEDGEEDGQE
jgi:hypothetical protein